MYVLLGQFICSNLYSVYQMLLLFLGKLQYLKITQPFTAIPENVSYIILEGTTGSLCWLTQDLRHI